MDEKKADTRSLLNLGLLIFLLLICATGFLISLSTLFVLPLAVKEDALKDMREIPLDPQLTLIPHFQPNLTPGYSPEKLNFTIHTPALKATQTLSLVAISDKRTMAKADCLADFNDSTEYEGLTRFDCTLSAPYSYLHRNDAEIFAVIGDSAGGNKTRSDASAADFDWTTYEGTFWDTSWCISGIALAMLLLCLLVSGAMGWTVRGAKHEVEYAGEYSLENLYSPLKMVGDMVKHPASFIASPLFWIVQLIGIGLLVLYIFMASEAWVSASALYSFLISGSFAFVIPFLVIASIWFIEYKEREPLRIIVSLFLWGGLACIFAIGINSIAGIGFELCALGFLTTLLVAPFVEEIFKGTGLVLFSFHHEYNDVADGIVYGFAIGMGFSFVEDWIYLMNNPLGADMGSWLLVWFMRSVMFATNHGVFTGITGAVIGYLKSRKIWWAQFGFVIGIIPAMIAHAIHNSGGLWQAICPLGGVLHMLVIAPLFDYGALILLMTIMVGWIIFRQKKN